MKFHRYLSVFVAGLLCVACASTETTETSTTAASATSKVIEVEPEKAAVADTAEADASEAMAAKTSDEEELVCRDRTRTATRLRGSEVCKTQDEWDRIEEDAKYNLKKLRRNQSTKGS